MPALSSGIATPRRCGSSAAASGGSSSGSINAATASSAQRQQQRSGAASIVARPGARGAMVQASRQEQQQPMLQKTMAGICAGVLGGLMLQAAPAILPASAFAAPSASLTEIQLHEAESMYGMIRDRTGTDFPGLASLPTAQIARPTRFVQAGQDATTSTISQLKGQLERMNLLLATEKQLVQADRQELDRLQQFVSKMRVAETMAPILAALPVSAPPVQIEAVQAAASTGFSALGAAGVGGLGLFAVMQQSKAKATKEELESQRAAERKRAAADEAQAAKLRQELAQEQGVVAQLRQQVETVEQRSRLQVTSEKRQRDLALRANEQARSSLEEERKRILAAKFEVIAAREKAQAALAARELEMQAKMQQALEREQQHSRLMVTSAKREKMLADQAGAASKQMLEAERKRVLATKMEVIAVQEKAQAKLAARELEMASKLDQAVEKEKQLGRLLLTSAKRESMLAVRTNNEVEKRAETDRKRMLATKMEIIDVREKAHATVVAKEEEMTIKMEQAVEKEKQTGRLWLTSSRRENMMAARANDELKKTAETDRKRMLATKMEIIDVREKAHATVVAKEEELTIKMNQAVEKEKQLGRLWLSSARRENLMAQRTNQEVEKRAETDRKRMLTTKMEIIDVREKAYATLAAKEQELTAKMKQAVDKEQQLGRLLLTSSKRENMLVVRSLEEAKLARDGDRRSMIAAKREAMAAREQAQADRVARDLAAATRLREAVEREQQRSRLLQASARREHMLLQRDAAAIKAAAETDRQRMIAARSSVLSTLERAQAERLAVEAEMMAKMKAEVERVQQVGRLTVASERRQVVEARRAVAEATKALDAERKQRIAAKSESLTYKEQAAAERSEKMAAVAEVERLERLVQRNTGAVVAAAPKAAAPQVTSTAAAAAVAVAQSRRVQDELDAAKGQVQEASAKIAAVQQQQRQRAHLPQQLQGEIEALSKKELQLQAQLDSLRSLASDSAADTDGQTAAALQSTIGFAQSKATSAAASTSSARAQLADATKWLSAADAEIKAAEAVRAAAGRRVSELEAVLQKSNTNDRSAMSHASPRSDVEAARAEAAELDKAKKGMVMSSAVAS